MIREQLIQKAARLLDIKVETLVSSICERVATHIAGGEVSPSIDEYVHELRAIKICFDKSVNFVSIYENERSREINRVVDKAYMKIRTVCAELLFLEKKWQGLEITKGIHPSETMRFMREHGLG